MQDFRKPVDRHKIAACMMYAIVMVSPIEIKNSIILKKYINIENFPREMQILVSSIMVNYLSLLIRSSSQNLDLVEDIFILLDNLPVKPLNCFGKIMKNFYRAYFQGDEEKIQDILDFFTNNDMNKISEILKVSI